MLSVWTKAWIRKSFHTLKLVEHLRPLLVDAACANCDFLSGRISNVVRVLGGCGRRVQLTISTQHRRQRNAGKVLCVEKVRSEITISHQKISSSLGLLQRLEMSAAAGRSEEHANTNRQGIPVRATMQTWSDHPVMSFGEYNLCCNPFHPSQPGVSGCALPKAFLPLKNRNRTGNDWVTTIRDRCLYAQCRYRCPQEGAASSSSIRQRPISTGSHVPTTWFVLPRATS